MGATWVQFTRKEQRIGNAYLRVYIILECALHKVPGAPHRGIEPHHVQKGHLVNRVQLVNAVSEDPVQLFVSCQITPSPHQCFCMACRLLYPHAPFLAHDAAKHCQCKRQPATERDQLLEHILAQLG